MMGFYVASMWVWVMVCAAACRANMSAGPDDEFGGRKVLALFAIFLFGIGVYLEFTRYLDAAR